MKRLLTLSSVLLLISCTADSFKLNFDKKSYDENKELWEKNNFHNYAFSQKVFTSYGGPQPKLRVIVVNDVLDTIFVQKEGAEDINLERLLYFKTIPETYDFINEVVESCREKETDANSPMEGADIKVAYDSQYHYPVDIDCTGHYPSGFDGGLATHVVISDFEVLENE